MTETVTSWDTGAVVGPGTTKARTDDGLRRLSVPVSGRNLPGALGGELEAPTKAGGAGRGLPGEEVVLLDFPWEWELSWRGDGENSIIPSPEEGAAGAGYVERG